MNILVSINHEYLKHFCAMYKSLCVNNACSKRLFVMNSNLTEEDKTVILTRFSDSEIVFIDLTEDYFKGFPKVKRYPYTIYFRILAPVLLPKDLDRVLYLDADLIVHGDLTPFYNVDFEGNAFYACTQIRKLLTRFNQIRLGVKKDFVYMNTGVMMMNLEYLRENLDQDAIKEFTIKHKWKLALYDQDILCRFFGNKIKVAERNKYNLADRHISMQNAFKKKKDKIDLDWVEKNNVIVHYLGRNKPWKKNYKGILGGYYKTYAED